MKYKEVTFDSLPETVQELTEKIERMEKILLEIQKSTGSNSDEIFDIQGAANFLNLKPATIYSLVSKGEIPVSKRGRKLIFSKKKLIDWSLEGERESISETRRKAIEKMQEARRNKAA